MYHRRSLAVWLALLAACTDAPQRPGPQAAPAPAASPTSASSKPEQAFERASSRLGAGPARYRIQPLPEAATPPARALEAAEPSEVPGFLGKPERGSLEQLRSGVIRSVKKGAGGRTLAFKLTFDSGAQAYYKPEQRVSS